jgi:hypothetical protein
VTFRDKKSSVTGTTCRATAVLPVRSNNVTIRACAASRRIADAGVYVGQSATILGRHNDVTRTSGRRNGVSRTPANGVAYVQQRDPNLNTGGMLVLSRTRGFPSQYPQCQTSTTTFFARRTTTENFGTGDRPAALAGGHRLPSVNANDTTPFHHNIARGVTTRSATR